MRKAWMAATLALAMSAMGAAQSAATGSQSSQQLKITQGPKVESTTGTQATIAWSTNVASGTIVKYGTDQNNLNQTAQAPWGSLTHRVTLKNLQPNTTYYYMVDSSQGQGVGGNTQSTVQQFQTAAQGQSAANSVPFSGQNIQVGPVVQDLSQNSAKLWWHSEDTSGATVKYGSQQGNLTQTATDNGGAQDHTVELSNLQPGQTIYFQVQKQDGSQLSQGQFTVPTQQAANNVKITAGPRIEYLTSSQAMIAWATTVPASSVVKYGTDPNALNKTAQAPWGQTTHRVTVQNLQPNTKYFFEVVSAQAQGSGSQASSAAGQFQTVSQGQAALRLSH